MAAAILAVTIAGLFRSLGYEPSVALPGPRLVFYVRRVGSMELSTVDDILGSAAVVMALR